MKQSKSEWEVKEGQVKIGTEWKSGEQLNRSLLIDIILAIAAALFSVYAFTISTLFGVVLLLVTVFFILTAIGSYSALKAVGSKVELKQNVKFKEKLQKMKMKTGRKVVEEVGELDTVDSAKLTRTSSKATQEVIGKLAIGGFLHVSKSFLVQLEDDTIVGGLPKATVTKLEAYLESEKDCKGFKAKITTIEENSSNNNEVNVDILALKH